MAQENQKPIEPIRSPPNFPHLERSKETSELRFSPNYSDSGYDNAWEWFQDAMAEDEEDTLQSLGELFTVSLRPAYRGVVAARVLTPKQQEEKLFYKPEKASRDVFYEWVEKRRLSAMKTVGKYSSTVILLGFLNPGAIHYGARTDIPYSALILLLHKLGFDPLKPFRNKDIRDKFQRRLGEIIVRKTAEALRAKRRVVLKPYIKRIAEEAVELVKDYIFGAVLPALKPDLEQSTMRARRYNESHWLAPYEGKRGIDEPMYETGKMCEEVSYTLDVPDGDISRMLDELYKIEEKEQRKREEILEDEKRARAKKIREWMEKRRAWQRKARTIHAKRKDRGRLPYKEEESARNKAKNKIPEEEDKSANGLAEYMMQIGGRVSEFDAKIKHVAGIDNKKVWIEREVRARRANLQIVSSYATDASGKRLIKDVVPKRKDSGGWTFDLVMEGNHKKEEISEEHSSAIKQAMNWVYAAIEMFKGLGK